MMIDLVYPEYQTFFEDIILLGQLNASIPLQKTLPLGILTFCYPKFV